MISKTRSGAEKTHGDLHNNVSDCRLVERFVRRLALAKANLFENDGLVEVDAVEGDVADMSAGVPTTVSMDRL